VHDAGVTFLPVVLRLPLAPADVYENVGMVVDVLSEIVIDRAA
jgi:hypothetical protein